MYEKIIELNWVPHYNSASGTWQRNDKSKRLSVNPRFDFERVISSIILNKLPEEKLTWLVIGQLKKKGFN